MQDLPDAPWIREAEMNGMPPYDDGTEPVCPICGRECETIYTDLSDTEIGCDKCIRTVDAYEWAQQHEEE